MIRLSAVLVAVAIGVLIGGIAASKLLLVYIAIAVSAAALVTLAAGVVLKREELFGEAQGPVPADAGAVPVLPAGTGESRDQIPSDAHAAPPSQLQGTEGYAAPFGGTAPASPATDRFATGPAGTGQGQGPRVGAVPPWEAPTVRDPWPSRPPGARPDQAPAGQDAPAAAAAGASPGSRRPSAWLDARPGSQADGWGAPGGGDPDATVADWSRAAPPASAVSPDVPAANPKAGPGGKPMSWFDRLGSPAGAVKPAAAPPSAPRTGSRASEGQHDWPARYSWLDDETDRRSEAGDAAGDGTAVSQAGKAGQAGAPGEADAGQDPESGSPAPARTGDGATATAGAPGTSAPVGAGDASPGDEQARPASGAATAAPGTAAAWTAGTAASGLAGPDSGEDADPDAASPDGLVSDPGPEARAAGETAEAGSEPPPAADAAAGAGLVAVIPGVPRYHDPDCVLIRFMAEGDLQRLSVPQAMEAGCTPCAACQPVG